MQTVTCELGGEVEVVAALESPEKNRLVALCPLEDPASIRDFGRSTRPRVFDLLNRILTQNATLRFVFRKNNFFEYLEVSASEVFLGLGVVMLKEKGLLFC